MFIFTYLISFLLGYMSLSAILKESKYFKGPIHVSFALVIGLCFSAYVTFFTFLIFNKFYPLTIVVINILCLLITIILPFKSMSKPRNLNSFIAFKKPTVYGYLMMICFALIIGIYYYIANVHPHGEWDAWAMWNMKMKFLILSQTPLEDILTNLSWHTHPDYPLLLPLMNVWLNSFSLTHMLYVPLLTALILTISCITFVYIGLSFFIKKGPSFLAAILLGCHPYFAFGSTQQYADILIALFLLMSLICFYLLATDNSPSIAILSGMILGFLTFSKNEGLVFAILLSIIILIRLWQLRRNHNTRLPYYVLFLISLLLTSLPTIIFKCFLAPPNSDILPNVSQTGLQMINIERLSIILNYVGNEIIHKKWCYIWILLLMMVVTKLFKFFKKDTIWITLFFFVYFVIIIFIYLISTQVRLNWWIPFSLPRIYFYMLPAIIFHVFYCFFYSKEQQPS